MTKIKKKLNVIRPTLRHKKIYVKVKYTKEYSSNLFSLFSKNYEKTNGVFSLIDSNLTVMESNLNQKTSIIRLNKSYKDSFLASLFFLKQDLGLIFVLKQVTSIKSLK